MDVSEKSPYLSAVVEDAGFQEELELVSLGQDVVMGEVGVEENEPTALLLVGRTLAERRKDYL